MSQTTREALDNAIRAHAADEWDGDLPVDWVLVTALANMDGGTHVGFEVSRDPMPAHITTGLLTEALNAHTRHQ